MKYLLIFLVCMSNLTWLHAQRVSGIVLDDNQNIVPNALIEDTINKVSVFSDLGGYFELKLTQKTILKVSCKGYETLYLDSNSNLDTILLPSKERLLPSITVNTDKVRPVMDELDQNILDYLFAEDHIFILLSKKGSKYLILKHGSTIIREFELKEISAKSLFEDCYGNIHILTKNKALQIQIDQQLQYVSEATIADFNTILKPCLGIIDSSFFISKYSNHNKKYTLAFKKIGEINYMPILTIFDSEAELSAKALYHEIINEYSYVYSDTVSDIILNGMWDGDIKDLAINYQLMTKVGFYEGVLAKEVTVQSFKKGNQVITFDMEFDSIYIHNQTGIEQSRKYYNLSPKNKSREAILYDQAAGQFYLLSNRNEIYSISLLDLSKSKTEQSVTIEIPFIENVKIHDNWIYFLINRKGYRKLYKKKY